MRTSLDRVAYLDGLRGIAIGCVLAAHVLHNVVPFGQGGYIGVDIFFVLSGFVITRILIRSPRSYGTFLGARVKRLYPALVAVCAMLPVLVVVTPGTPVDASETVLSSGLGLVQGTSIWFATGGDGLGALGVTWSLAIEWYFYLLWPLLVTLALRRRVSNRSMAAICGVSALALWLISAATLSDNWFYYGPGARFGSLLLGCAMAYYTSAPAGRRATGNVMSSMAATSMTAAAVVVFATYSLIGPEHESDAYRWVGFPVVTALAAALILAGQRQPRAVGVRFLGWWPLAGLGLVSYSLYLWHVVPIRLLGDGALGIDSSIVRSAISLVFIAVATAVSYLLLERPRQRSASGSLTTTQNAEKADHNVA